jgi:hypothetical protein
LRSQGTVRNLADRRTDLYELRALKPNGRLVTLKQHVKDHYVFNFLNPDILKPDPTK